MIGQRSGVLDHDSKNGTIHRRLDENGRHGPLLRLDRAGRDADPNESGLHNVAEPCWECTYVARGDEDRQKRNGADQDQEWMAPDDNSVHVPIAEGGVGDGLAGLCDRQQWLQFPSRSQYDHARRWVWLTAAVHPRPQCVRAGGRRVQPLVRRHGCRIRSAFPIVALALGVRFFASEGQVVRELNGCSSAFAFEQPDSSRIAA